MSETQRPSRIELLAQADLVLLLADLFRPQIPADALALEPHDVEQLLGATGLSGPDRLAERMCLGLSAARDADPQLLRDEHVRLFEGAMVCPLNETAYIRRDKGAIIGDLAGFYRAFGCEPSSATGEKPDHLLAELEFVAALLTMSAEAETPEQVQVASDALAAFATSHLGDWLPAVCRHLGQTTALAFFAHASDALETLWTELVKAHRWPVADAPPAAARPQAEPESPYECIVPAAPEPVELTVDGLPLA